jgi:hypothetical protein
LEDFFFMMATLHLLGQAWDLFRSFATLDTPGKISGLVMLLIAFWKSSLAQPYWAKLGSGQVLVAPALALIVTACAIQPFSWTALWVSVMSGTLAIGIHQLLDGLKGMPWVGPRYVSLIDFFESFFHSPNSPAVQAKKAIKANRKAALNHYTD